MKIKNTQLGPRGIHTTAGSVFIDPGTTLEADVSMAEFKSASKTGWFEFEGDPVDDVELPRAEQPAGVSDTAIKELQQQLMAKDRTIQDLQDGNTNMANAQLKSKDDEIARLGTDLKARDEEITALKARVNELELPPGNTEPTNEQIDAWTKNELQTYLTSKDVEFLPAENKDELKVKAKTAAGL